MQLVGNAFGCKIIWCPGYSHDADYWGRFEFVGPKGQLELVEYAATYLQRKLVKARADFAQELPKHFTRKEKTRQLDGFAKGWLNAISVKLIAFTNPKDVEDAIEERLKNLNTAKIDDRGHGQHGHLHGMADGLNVEIHRPMNKGEDAKQLGGA